MPAFTQQEYRERTNRLRQQMAERGIDALLVLNETNMNYLTGYEGYSDYVPQLALVCQDEEDPWLILRELDTFCAYPTSYLPESRILSYPEKYIWSSERTPWEPIGALVKERARSSRIGVEMGAKMFGMKSYAALANNLDLSKAVDADSMVAALQRVKSPAELAYMEQAGTIVDKAMQVGRLEIAMGARECDVAAAVQSALLKGTPEFPGGPCYGAPTMPVGSPANAPHLKWSDATYKMRCQTNFEFGAFRHRYACGLSRTVFLGEPSARAQHLHRAAVDGFLAQVDAIRPGAKCSDVSHAFKQAFEPYGVRKESRSGYSIGIDWTGDLSFQADDHNIIEPDMTFHVIVGIWEKEDGYVFSETVRVTENGAKSFSNMSRDLLVNY
ncbi:MAG: M24 family metallopeptidase [Mesorhizobium sp.]|uniref:M24 family metallopeptidase n=1 Tax=Mesorhizobium sp. TaxID=1871066 RepID=UPI001228CCF5|nr:Xaa-Pro peptidase family protein [Mesorhizobium sp.]TIL20969.1 MAG: M24 family metallopeptidase [Mesorhizobium sp.]TIQ36375.1 MAG: M24 family metallopeptidase [Mesorhizobium sp.]TIW60013.1 MAG: M24 family metallopeptidase [Mesorhizobium sp.]TIW69442.1 MAG: M24 family metallopeptidase [Mesorhizobium sp.]TJW31295.1 MAG: M24 family metallopeptidase [Mesorhizobium sp.]